MSPVDREATGYGLRTRWDPDARVMSLELPHDLTAEAAAWLLARVDAWTGDDGAPYAFASDCAKVGFPGPGWRSTLADYFARVPANTASLACYHVRPEVRVSLEMFNVALTHFSVRIFESRDEALDWLDTLPGIGPCPR